MAFSDFIESVVGVPICRELKQYLDRFYESYSKNPEKLKTNNTQEAHIPLYEGLRADMVIIDEFLTKEENNER